MSRRLHFLKSDFSRKTKRPGARVLKLNWIPTGLQRGVWGGVRRGGVGPRGADGWADGPSACYKYDKMSASVLVPYASCSLLGF
jgi:hypothetical protein